MAKKPDHKTLDLFTDWKPSQELSPRHNSKREIAQGPDFAAKFSAAISSGLCEDSKPRDHIVSEMKAWLGDEISGKLSKNILDAWASESREDQMPSPVRLAALLIALKDKRILNLFAELCGWAVIDAKYLPAIHEAMIADEIDQQTKHLQHLEQQKKKARTSWKGTSL